MSDLSATKNNFFSLIEGKIDFNEFISDEGKLIEENISSVAAPVQPFLQMAYDSLKAGASSLVGAGETALGPIISASSDSQATMLLNAMSAAGIPTNGILTIAEHAALVTLINGFKAMLDRMHIQYATPNATAPNVAAVLSQNPANVVPNESAGNA